jgi:hypothetical protein
VLGELVGRKRVAVRGPHGLGKTAVAALAILWFALTRDDAGIDWKIPTTASAWRQLEKYLWPEVHKWAAKLKWRRIGRRPFQSHELLRLNLKLTCGEAFAVASDNASLIEGAHADAVFYLFDEAKTIPAETWDAAEGAFAGAGQATGLEAYALAVSTPGEPSGRFYDIHRRAPGYEDWWPRHVTVDETIAALRVSREWVDARRRQWGENSAVYKNRALGEFASSDEDGVIPLAWVEQANERWRTWRESGQPPPPLTRVGADIGGGSDPSVLALRNEHIITELRRSRHEDGMVTAGLIKNALSGTRACGVIDVIGIGANVYHKCREEHCNVAAFNASEGTTQRDSSGTLEFLNCRAAGWWGLRELLDPSNQPTIALPPDDLLTGDLTAPHWWVTGSGKIQIESKEDLRSPKRLGRSTDSGDSVMQAFARVDETVLVAPIGDSRPNPMAVLR